MYIHGRTLDALVGDWSENLIVQGITNTDVNSKEVSKETIVDKMKKTPTRKSLGGMRMAGRYGAGILAALAVGVMLIAAAPGGATSNIITSFAKGDVALSVSLTAIIIIIIIKIGRASCRERV